MNVREMTEGDVEAVVPLELEVARRSYRDDAVKGPDFHAQRIADALDRRWDHLFVAEDDGGVRGYAWLSVQRDRATDDRYGLLKSLSVAEDAREQGVGRALLARIEEEARDLELSRIRLIVGADNRDALSFYEDAGFAERTRLMEKPLDEAAGDST